MLEKIQDYIQSNSLFSFNHKIIVAISGGSDSVCLAHTLLSLKYSIVFAHCNFMLRGEESYKDEKFVEELAYKWNVPFYLKRFDTQTYSTENKISIEMAARELRYSWFADLKKEIGAHYIAVAHNKNDSIETFLLNLIRGTGINGLTGIKPMVKDIVRPLLFADKTMILEYCNDNGLTFCTDSTNAETKYTRNKIRNVLIPQMQEINPSIIQTLWETIDKMNDYKDIKDKFLEELLPTLVHIKDDRIYIDIKKTKETISSQTVLFELLQPYNFNSSQVVQILSNSINESGKQFLSQTH
ncbi:MAG: tRNA lysidine(34) synthetase TilS, partial [Bacteroidales bacterium]